MAQPGRIPSNNGVTLVVAGLEGCLDLLSPDVAEIWLDEAVKSTILSFQDEYAGEASLIFWMPSAHGRLKVQPTTDSVTWVCGAPNQGRQIDFGRILWGEANEYPQEILLAQGAKPAGLFHLRIT